MNEEKIVFKLTMKMAMMVLIVTIIGKVFEEYLEVAGALNSGVYYHVQSEAYYYVSSSVPLIAITIGMIAAAAVSNDKTPKRKGMMLFLHSCMVSFLLMSIGMIVSLKLPEETVLWIRYIPEAGGVLLLCMFPLNCVLKKKYIKKQAEQEGQKIRKTMTADRNSVEENLMQQLASLKRLRNLTDLYTAVLAILTVSSGLSLIMMAPINSAALFCVGNGFFIYALYLRIRYPQKKSVFETINIEEAKNYVTAQEYPKIYAIAGKAEKLLQLGGKIKIVFTTDCSVKISKIPNGYLLKIGMVLLQTFSEEELYHVLLREFFRVSEKHYRSQKEDSYHAWLHHRHHPELFSKLTEALFAYSDTVYDMQYDDYCHMVSVLEEMDAEQVMRELGDSRAADSLLLKLNYYHTVYQWEKRAKDEAPFYDPEKFGKDYLHKEISSFKKALEKKLQTVRYEKSDDYAEECEKAVAFMEELIYQEWMSAEF